MNQNQNNYKLPTQLVFFGVGMGISHFLKLYNNPLKFRLTVIIMSFILSGFYADFKCKNRL